MEITALKQCNKHLISMLQREHFDETRNLLNMLTLSDSIKIRISSFLAFARYTAQYIA